MKRHSFALEIIIFSVILIFFIVPPFFVQKLTVDSTLFTDWSFPWAQFTLALLSAVLCYFFYEQKKAWLIIFPALFSVCLLFCNALVLKFAASILLSPDAEGVLVELPDDFTSWLFCILNFMFAAFYEETLYRMYFTDALKNLLERKVNWKYLGLICEVLGCAVFAFAHLYLGVFAVINAAVAHVILRWCFKKSGNIWCGFAAHFIYNVISLILL